MLLLPLLASCVDDSDARDRDGDGYEAFQVGGSDCDDSDPAVNPGVDEVCGDNIDNDCDSLVDDRGIGEQTFYRDADGDGFGAPEPVLACTAPAGHVQTAGDCNDNAAGVHPGADEIWYDGVDQDCLSDDDYDQDGDGFASAAESEDGTDCDDTLPAVNPGATEICGNQLDDDCDGTHNDCLWPTNAWADQTTATVTYGGVETPRVQVGDTDGDGSDELLVWVEGATSLVLFDVAPDDDLEAADAATTITLPATNADAYAIQLLPDVSGDGAADLLVGEGYPLYDGEISLYRRVQSGSDLDVGDRWRVGPGPDNGDNDADLGFGHMLAQVTPLPGAQRLTWATHDGGAGPERCYLFNDAFTSSDLGAQVGLEIQYCSEILPGVLYHGADPVVVARFGDTLYFVDTTQEGPIDLRDEEEWQDVDPNVRILGFPEGGYAPLGADCMIQSTHSTTGIEFLRIMNDSRSGFAVASGLTINLLAPADILHDGLKTDLNGDGEQDLLVLAENIVSNHIEAYFGPLPVATLTTPPIDAFTHVPQATSLVAGDFNGDGYSDVALPSVGAVYVLFGEGR